MAKFKERSLYVPTENRAEDQREVDGEPEAQLADRGRSANLQPASPTQQVKVLSRWGQPNRRVESERLS